MMEMIEELLQQLDGWISLQDCSDKDQSQRVISQMIVNHVKTSDADAYCRIVSAPSDTPVLYERFLTYLHELNTEDDIQQQASAINPVAEEILNRLDELNMKLDNIENMLRNR